MSDLTDLAAATAAVADPTTSAADLAAIVQAYPSLRAPVALHPNAYPSLIDWLGNLGDPEVSTAVASRRARDTQAMTTSMTPPMTQPVTSPPMTQPMPQTPYSPQYGPVPQMPKIKPVIKPTSKVPLIAGILFFVGAAIGIVAFAINDFDGCHVGPISFPLGWSGYSGYACEADVPTGVLTMYGFASIEALVGCGVISIMMGKKNILQTNYLIGVILGSITAISMVVDVIGILHFRRYQPFFTNENFVGIAIVGSFLLLAVPVAIIMMGKSTSVAAMKKCRIGLIIALVVDVFVTFIGPALSRDYFGFPSAFFGNVPFFVAVLLMAYALKDPTKIVNSQIPVMGSRVQ